MQSHLIEATLEDVPSIVSLLQAMQEELQEFELDEAVATQSITRAMQEQTQWFVFKDENHKLFGCCYLEPVHSYWNNKRRYYLGGFYIQPQYRGTGRFKTLNAHMQEWANKHDGYQIYAHIHEENTKSLQVFNTVGFEESSYKISSKLW